MTEPTGLDPDTAHYGSGQEMQEEGFLDEQNERDGGEEEKEGEKEGEGEDQSLVVEESLGGDAADEVAVGAGDRGDVAVREAANEVRGEEGVSGRGVVGEEGVGGVKTGEGEEREVAAGMEGEPLGDVVDEAVDGKPERGGGVVAAELIGGDERQCG